MAEKFRETLRGDNPISRSIIRKPETSCSWIASREVVPLASRKSRYRTMSNLYDATVFSEAFFSNSKKCTYERRWSFIDLSSFLAPVVLAADQLLLPSVLP